MGTRQFSGANAGATTASADPDVLRGALVVVAAAAGLVWALSHGSNEGARPEPAPEASPGHAQGLEVAAQENHPRLRIAV